MFMAPRLLFGQVSGQSGIFRTGVIKMRLQWQIAALVLALSTVQAVACAFDTDCSPGSKCVKPAGRVNGMCTGGQFPGNKYDKNPYSDPFDPNRTA
jgi:hypothetical protein